MAPGFSRSRRLKLGVILVVVGVVVWVGGHGALRGWENQRRLVCASLLKNLAATAKLYAAATESAAPQPVVDVLIAQGLIDREKTFCPGNYGAGSNYVVIFPRPAAGETGDRIVIAFEPVSNHGGEGGHVVFADGHARFVLQPDYDRLIDATHLATK